MADAAARAGAADHNIHPDLARELRAIAAVPMDLRRPALRRLTEQIGNIAMVDLFGEFIGLAAGSSRSLPVRASTTPVPAARAT